MFKQVAKQAPATQRGQGMTEYIIIVALIAVAAIITYQFFGSTVRNQTASIAAEVGGSQAQAVVANDAATKAGSDGVNAAKKENKLDNYNTATTQ